MKITWFGHSAFRLEFGASVVMIDPFLTGNPAFGGDAAFAVHVYADFLQPRHGVRSETEGDNHRIASNHFFAACDDFGTLAAFLIRLAHAGTHDFDAGYLTCRISVYRQRFGFDFNRLGVKLELHALFFGVGVFFFTARHIGRIAAVHAGHFRRALANGGTHAVHRCVAAAQHYHAFTGHAHIVGRIEIKQVLRVAD